MGFVCLGTELVTALDRITRVTAKEPVKLVLTQGKDHIVFLAEHDSRCIRYPVPASILEDFTPIAIPVDRLKSACAKRAAMSFKVAESSLHFKAKEGSFKGELFLKEPTEVDFPHVPIPKNALLVTREIIDLFGYVELSSDISQSDMTCFIDTNAKLKLASANNNVAALLQYNEKLPLAKVSTNLLVKYIGLFNTIFGKDEYHLLLTDNFILASCRDVQIKLPVFDPGVLSLANVENVLVSNKPSVQFSVDLDKLSGALQSLKSVFDKGKPLDFVVKGSTLTVKILSNYGKATDTIEILNKKGQDCSLSMSYDMVMNMFSVIKVTGAITLGIVKDTALRVDFKSTNFHVSYLMASVTE